MTSTLMKALTLPVSMTKVFWIAAILAVVAAGQSASLPSDARCAKTASAYPSFCEIPQTPTDIRDPATFHEAVIATRKAGARVALGSQRTSPAPPLELLDAFARDARANAAYPASPRGATNPALGPFAEDARRLATPPARRKR